MAASSTIEASPSIDWAFLGNKGHPHPTNGRPIIIPHLTKLASHSKELLERLRRPLHFQRAPTDEAITRSSSTTANLPSLRAANRYIKAFNTLKNGGLFAAPPLMGTSKVEVGRDAEVWDSLRLKYEQLSGTLVNDAIADKFRVATCRAFDNDHAEWEREKSRFLKQFESHANKLHDISVDRMIGARSRFPSLSQQRSTVGAQREGDEWGVSSVANTAEFRFLQWLYEGAVAHYPIAFTTLLDTPEAMFPSLPELKDIWKLVYIYGRVVRDKLSLSVWIQKVISILELQSHYLQHESLQSLKHSSPLIGSTSFEGIEQIIAYVELTRSFHTERYSPHWYWSLAYQAFRCGNMQSLLELSGIRRSPVFSLENQPPNFTSVCKAVAHRLYSSLPKLGDAFEQWQNVPPQILDASSVSDLSLSNLSLAFKVSDGNLDPYLHLLLSFISSTIWPPINISQTSKEATQEDYMWYKFRLMLLSAEHQPTEASWVQKLRALASRIRDLGPEYFGGTTHSSEDPDTSKSNNNTLGIGYSRILMYSGCFGEALHWMQENIPWLERVPLLFTMYLINCEGENSNYAVVDIPQYSHHPQLLEKLFVRGLRNAPLTLKLLYLKTLPETVSFRIFQCFVTEDFQSLSADDVLGKFSSDGKLQQGDLANMIMEEGDQQASEALLPSIYRTMGRYALQKNNLDVAFRCYYFAGDEYQCKDVLERMLNDRNFDIFKELTHQEEAQLELYLIYYEIAAEKWTCGNIGSLSRMYTRASFYYMTISGKYMRALEWFQKHDLLHTEGTITKTMRDDPYVVTKLIACYAHCISQLAGRGDFQVFQGLISTEQIEQLLYDAEQLHQFDPKRMEEAHAVLKEYIHKFGYRRSGMPYHF